MAEPIKLRGLDIILTYECTGRCAHCCYRAGPGQNRTMSVAEVADYLAAVTGYPLDWILLFGGEPFVCYDLLRASIAMAAPMAGVLVFTNGSWATDRRTAIERLPAALGPASPGAAQAAEASQCPLPGYLGGDIRAPTTVEIHPGGWVNLCAGLALGNAQQRPLSEILAGYDPDAHPVVSVLAQEGPEGLLRLARRSGYAPRGPAVDGCHQCYQVRSWLRPTYPDLLAPAHVYAWGT